MTKIALLCSTGASVAKFAYKHDASAKIDLVITDRQCGATELAEMLDVPLITLPYVDRATFSSGLLQVLSTHNVSYLLSFYTRLLAEPLISAYSGRLLNFHPSLLPACPGQHGFEDTMQSGALLFGSTVHLIDAGVDTGMPVLQIAAIKTPEKTLQENRHLVFAQQCASYSQIIRWLRQQRLTVTGNNVIIERADYQHSLAHVASVPALDETALWVYDTILRQSIV